ncbi:SRPBCC domain-containing protein [Psychroserpens sp. SPM9]|uniref:SRPBCC domain-containing protein n=1 Tax=Psychroserpens sp. SPM9 TaxID=2975598 RepID=UPI0021A81C2B|nr:SRPBCC domain-containing protein [Psychroserpens sp. SPM9]MDG5492032.1 SRPBCC domain-containing protein [Psychroserpens sp. SPM9]
MKLFQIQIILLCFSITLYAQETEKRVTSVIDSSQTDNMVLKQSFVVNVSLDSVWNAYTTKKGWESWVAAKAEIDFKINGIIKTTYDKDAKIGDDSTIILHITNYIPKRMLTLQATLTKNFPEFMKADEDDLYNIILFEPISANQTKVISYGIGYKNNVKYMSLMKFFIKGNEQSYRNLISYLETGKPSINY